MNDLHRAILEALHWYHRWNECHPEVGMGPFLETELDDVLEESKIKLTDAEKKEILKEYKKSGRYY